MAYNQCMDKTTRTEVLMLHGKGMKARAIAVELAIPVSDVIHVIGVDEDAVIEDYRTLMHLPVKAIAEKHGIKTATLYAILDRSGIPRRTTTDAIAIDAAGTQANGRKAQLDDAVARYVRGEKIRTIVRETGVAQPTLHYELRRRNVQLRRHTTPVVEPVAEPAEPLQMPLL